jgi:uncharacterized SAM-binding protein YcdF (DUF218 family)
MFYVNKVVGFLLNPLMLGMLMVLAAYILHCTQRKKLGGVFNLLAVLWFWVWSTNAFYKTIGYRLEKEFPPVAVEKCPRADAIVVLGGGMGSNTNVMFADMGSAADRVWHAARLYRAGKAPIVIPSGLGENESTVPLLLDFGVPKAAILPEVKARNTEENALYVEELLKNNYSSATNRTILLVTSAWHMRRSVLLFSKTSLRIIPAPADHEAFVFCSRDLIWKDYLPETDMFYRNSTMCKEYLGYWFYCIKENRIRRK